MNVSFEGINGKPVTFINSNAAAGQVVKVSAAGTVSACSAADEFDGVAVLADGGFAGICMDGFVTVSYSGTAPTVGHSILCADGDGGVKVAATGTTYVVVDVDTTAKTVTFAL